MRFSKLLNSNVSIFVLLYHLPPLTANQLAMILSSAYVGLGLTHLNNRVK